MTCPRTIAIGAYVLGALDPGEQVDFERHLPDCAKCRDALLEFAHLPGLLHTVALEDITDPDLDVYLDSVEPLVPAPPVRPARSRGRMLLVAAVAVVVALAGGWFGRQLLTDQPPQAGTSVTWSTTNGVGGIDITARLTSESWGTGIALRMQDLPPGERCKLVVHGRDGATETTGWWSTTYTGQADVPASSSVALSDIDRLEVVTDDNTVLTSLEPGR